MSQDAVAATPQASPMRPARVPLRVVLPIILVCVYLPYSWVFWYHYPWTWDERGLWIMLLPLLPGLYPAAAIDAVTGWQHHAPMFVLAGLITVGGIVLLTYLGMRSRWLLIMTAFITLALCVFCAYAAYSLYRA